MNYQVAEKFKSLQGEGVYSGCPMAFIRFTGCSVGKKVCHFCDTDFDQMMPWRGGGAFTPEELVRWTFPYEHICCTGGDPLDQDLLPLVEAADSLTKEGPSNRQMFHIETSGTIPFPAWFKQNRERFWICVSPKPGYLMSNIAEADEVKVIYTGLGNGPGWPGIAEANRWAAGGSGVPPKVVFIQPRNDKMAVNKMNLKYVVDLLRDNPALRLSTQMHKILGEQ